MAPKRKFSLVDLEHPLPSSTLLSLSSSNASLEDKEVTLHIESLKTFTIKVKGSETIRNIKALINQKEITVSYNFPELVISGNQFKDGNKLSDYITAGDSAVNVVCRERIIIVNVTKITNNGIVSTGVEAKLSDTVGQLRSLIEVAEGAISGEYSLVFDGDHLRDDMTLGGSGLENDSVVYMVLNPVDTFQLYIGMPCGRIDRVTVKRLQKVFDLKVALQKEIEIPINQWRLKYSANFLEDFKTVSDCGFKANSYLAVVLPKVQIFVRIQSGMQITVFIKLTDDVSKLKKKIFKKASYPIKYLTIIFAGKVLREGQRISTYGIKRDSTVHICYNARARG